MRINARLDDSRSQKLEYLAYATNQGTSEIVKQAIDVYYERVKKSTRSAPAEVLAAVGFVGCGEASPDLAARYKDELEDVLTAKHDHR